MAHEVVVQAILGTGAALSGLVLVFLGIILAALDAFPADTPAKVLTGYRWSARLAVADFVVGLAVVALALIWMLLEKHNQPIYAVVVILFFVQLGLLVPSGLYVVLKQG